MPRTMRRASSAVGAKCTMAPAARGLALELLEVEVEMRQRVVLDVAADVAQRLELRQRRRAPRRAGAASPGATSDSARCSCVSASAARGVVLEGRAR